MSRAAEVFTIDSLGTVLDSSTYGHKYVGNLLSGQEKYLLSFLG